MSETIRIPSVPSDLTTADAYADVALVISGAAGRELRCDVAREIASWWQSSGGVGHVLASFASGVEVSKQVLLADIHATRVHHGYSERTMDERDRNALDCLSTFVIHLDCRRPVNLLCECSRLPVRRLPMD